jgi:hypothetical protein
MTTASLITNAWVRSNGELPTFTSGSDEWNYLLNLANYFIDQWANESGVDWNSLYDPAYALGTIGAGNTVEIDTGEVRKISQEYGDSIRIKHLDGTYSDYDLISADEMQNHSGENVCARVGENLVFDHSFVAADAQYGGTVTIPAYLYPGKLTGDKSTVPVDNPNWLVAIVAADVARNDILRKDQYPILTGEANAIMERMRSDNEGQLQTVGLSWRPDSGYGGYSGNYNGYGER